MSLTMERVTVVSSNANNLCALLNVADEQHFLQRCMSSEVFQDCISGDTNMTRVQILCEKMIHELLSGSTKIYDALCTYFLERSESYKCMHQRFAAIGPNGGSSSISVKTELVVLGNKAEDFTQELPADYPTDLFTVEDQSVEKKPSSVHDGNVHANDILINTTKDVALFKVEKFEPETANEQEMFLEQDYSGQCNVITQFLCTPASHVRGQSTENQLSEADVVETSHLSHLAEYVPAGKKPLACEVCGKTFKDRSHLQQHFRVHTGEKPFACEYCGKQFSRKCHLVDHVRVHTGETPYECEQCGQKFRWRIDFVRHIRHHNGEKPFACEHCTKMFGRKHDLLQHVRVHTGEKPFICEHCGKAFRGISDLWRHKDRQHPDDTMRTSVRIGSSST